MKIQDAAEKRRRAYEAAARDWQRAFPLLFTVERAGNMPAESLAALYRMHRRVAAMARADLMALLKLTWPAATAWDLSRWGLLSDAELRGWGLRAALCQCVGADELHRMTGYDAAIPFGQAQFSEFGQRLLARLREPQETATGASE